MEPARDPTPRWHYRYDNFHRAHSLLREAVELMHERALTPLEQEGAIQRFEYCWELAWKTLKDYLEQQGIQLPTVTPAAVLRAATRDASNSFAEHMRALEDAAPITPPAHVADRVVGHDQPAARQPLLLTSDRP